LKLAIPILQAAADENREELLDLWARLLAAAMDPTRRDLIRQSFIQIVKAMDPFDVLVLKAVADNGQAQWMPNGRDAIVLKLQCSKDEVLVSFDNLKNLNCIKFNAEGAEINPYLTSQGILLMNAVNG
jgi:hypothetical protein